MLRTMLLALAGDRRYPLSALRQEAATGAAAAFGRRGPGNAAEHCYLHHARRTDRAAEPVHACLPAERHDHEDQREHRRHGAQGRAAGDDRPLDAASSALASPSAGGAGGSFGAGRGRRLSGSDPDQLRRRPDREGVAAERQAGLQPKSSSSTDRATSPRRSCSSPRPTTSRRSRPTTTRSSGCATTRSACRASSRSRRRRKPLRPRRTYLARSSRRPTFIHPTTRSSRTASSIPGAYASPSQPVLQVARIDRVWINVNVPDEYLSYVRSGNTVSFSSSSFPGRHFTGADPDRKRRADLRDPFLPGAARTAKPGLRSAWRHAGDGHRYQAERRRRNRRSAQRRRPDPNREQHRLHRRRTTRRRPCRSGSASRPIRSPRSSRRRLRPARW